jgi:NAD(P)-dependent dehydrogenase (short-subunit alcohol dehydrogenase family)
MNSKNKIALVTGANRGIGKEIARQLVDLGFFVIMTGRDLEKLNSAQLEVDPEKKNSSIIQIDLSNKNQIKESAKEISKITDRIDVLINNAAIIGTTKGAMNMNEEEFQGVIETNSFGPLYLTRALFPFLKKSNSARVINLSSGMGSMKDLTGNYAAYRLSKAFLNMITILLANEFEKDGIKVNTMCPGWVKTDMGGKSATRSVERGAETAVWLATEKNIPTGKFFRDKKEISY